MWHKIASHYQQLVQFEAGLRKGSTRTQCAWPEPAQQYIYYTTIYILVVVVVILLEKIDPSATNTTVQFMELRTEDSTNTRSLETQCSIIFMSLASLNWVVKLDNQQAIQIQVVSCKKKFLHLLPNFGHISIFDGSGTQKSDFFRYPFPPLMAPHNTYSRIYYLKII